MVDAMNQPSRNLVETPMGAQVDMKKLMRANGVEAAIIHLRRPKRVGVLSDSHATSGAARKPSRADIGASHIPDTCEFSLLDAGKVGLQGGRFLLCAVLKSDKPVSGTWSTLAKKRLDQFSPHFVIAPRGMFGTVYKKIAFHDWGTGVQCLCVSV